MNKNKIIKILVATTIGLVALITVAVYTIITYGGDVYNAVEDGSFNDIQTSIGNVQNNIESVVENTETTIQQSVDQVQGDVESAFENSEQQIQNSIEEDEDDD